MAESLPDLNRNASLAYVKVEPDEAEGLTALEEFGTKGLTSAQAAAQQAKWGRNEIPEEKEPLWRMFAMQFVGTMPAMIEIAMLLSAVIGSWVDFWIIFMLLMTNATLGFIEEMNAQASIAALKDGLVRKLPIKRDGAFVPMDIVELVPGDIVFLRGGNVVPADGMWVEGDELAVDQVSATRDGTMTQSTHCQAYPRLASRLPRSLVRDSFSLLSSSCVCSRLHRLRSCRARAVHPSGRPYWRVAAGRCAARGLRGRAQLGQEAVVGLDCQGG